MCGRVDGRAEESTMSPKDSVVRGSGTLTQAFRALCLFYSASTTGKANVDAH